jgi:triacylglycerol lipase
MGHSAGAAHVAGYVFREMAKEHVIAGAILFSGVYAVPESVPENSNDEQYFGADASLRAEQSPAHFIAAAPKIPMMVMFAQYDPPFMQLASMEVIQRLCARDQNCPTIVQIPGHNHLSEIFHFDTADDSGARESLDFIHREPDRR